jgi:hypothetical protein
MSSLSAMKSIFTSGGLTEEKLNKIKIIKINQQIN